MAEYTWYFNGEWVPSSQVKIDPLDRGFLLGDVVYDAARTFNGKIFRMREHIDRLYRSLKYVGIDPGLSAEEMLNICEELAQRNESQRGEVGDYMIHPFVTRGPFRGIRERAQMAAVPTVGVLLWPLNFAGFARNYTGGVDGVIVRTRSYSPEMLDPKVKHHSRMSFNIAEREAAAVDPNAKAILTDTDGNLTEGIGYNVLMVTDGVIRSPDDRSILQGVSRGMVFDLARQLEIPFVEEDLQPYDLYTADEAFFSTTSRCIEPVTRVDGRQISDGKPGPITQQLLAAWSEAVGMDIVDQAVRFARG